MRRASATTSTEAVSSIRTWPSEATGTPRRYGAARRHLSMVTRGVVALEALDGAP